MLQTKYFNLPLLCAASILIAATTQTSPLHTYAQRFSSTSTSSTPPSTSLPSPDSLSPKQRPTVNLDSVTSHQIDEIYANTYKIRRQLEKLNSNNKWIRFIALLTAAQTTAYIIDNDPDLNAKMHKAIDTLKEKCTQLKTYLRPTKQANESSSPNEHADPIDGAPSTPHDNQSNTKA